MNLIRIPAVFYWDHDARALPTPIPWKQTRQHVWIDRRDPNIGELLSDARHYASADGPDMAPLGIILSARATVRALTETLVPK